MYVKSSEQLADIFTKGVNGSRLLENLKKLNVLPAIQQGRELEYAATDSTVEMHLLNSGSKEVTGR